MNSPRRHLLIPTGAILLTVLLAACAAPAADGAAPAAPSASAAPSTSAPAPPSTPAGQASESGAGPAAVSAKPTPAPGRFVDLADYRKDRAAFHAGDVVLFFNATWCPTCQEATRNLTADPTGLGKGVTVVSVDYDANTDLRQEYGVTYQHTFVLIDEDGTKRKAWSGSSTPQQIADEIG